MRDCSAPIIFHVKMTRASRPIDITYFYRHPTPSFFSIERVFDDIQAVLSPKYKVRRFYCPCVSRGILRRVWNALCAALAHAEINHVTGDTHYLAIFLMGPRTVLTIHDCVMMRRLKGIPRAIYYFFWLWWPIKKAAVVTVVSKSIADELSHHVSGCSNKIRIIPNPISTEFVYTPKNFRKESPRILFLGTSENKNLERTTQALQGLNCDFIVVGRLTSDQKDQLNQSGIRWEQFQGLRSNQLVEQYVASDLVLFPSLYEGFGLPIIEAQAVGRPVVTSNLEPMIEVSGGAACLVDPYSITSIRSGVVQIIEDQPYRDSLIRQGRVNVQRYSLAAIGKEYERLYAAIGSG